MLCFNKFFVSVFLAVVCSSFTLAVPWPTSSKHATHRVRDIGNGFQISTFHPESSFETFGHGIDPPFSRRDNPSLEDAAISFVSSHLGVDAEAITFKSGFSGEVSKHGFVKQTHDGVPFANAVANVGFSLDNKIVSFGSSFVKPTNIASAVPSVSLEDAISTAEKALSGTYNGHPAKLEYLVQDDGSVALTHAFQIRNPEKKIWVEAFVDAHSGSLLSIVDFTAKSSYLVLPITKEVPTQGFQTLTDPYNKVASPNGWHSDGKTTYKTTSGNNAVVFGTIETNVTTESSAGLNFIFKENPKTDPSSSVNVNAARTNAFYIVNTVHDITYLYGFTEKAFNFQNNNFGKGGLGNDRVQVSVQEPDEIDNASFNTPPDGQSGSMDLDLWDTAKPWRDGALENDIIAHENTHGLTNRMTGGGTGDCLQTLESGGLGEGWSDAFAEWTEHVDDTVPDYVIGPYVNNTAAGFRTHPYSTSAITNPLRYSNVKKLDEVHDIGEVWANMLHNVYAKLVAANGFSKTAHTDASGTAGNVVFLHLFIDALPIQPCNPTFLTARDAWIQADVNRYKGAHKCILWKAFASRGLGVKAAKYKDDTSVPAGC